VGILGTIFGRREPAVQYRTVDGGHPAPYPDMTDEQLYNYEVTFNVPRRTFDKPPRSAKAAGGNATVKKQATPRKEPPAMQESIRDTRTIFDEKTVHAPHEEKTVHAPRNTTRSAPPQPQPQPQAAATPADLPPLDFSKPVRLVTTKQPVEIITTRARHPVYKVHGYIGDDDVVTVFTSQGQLSENGPRYLENAPQRQTLYLNIYPNRDAGSKERYALTQHETKAEADAAAKPGRIACVPLEFDL
jgi:hypothetical protein